METSRWRKTLVGVWSGTLLSIGTLLTGGYLGLSSMNIHVAAGMPVPAHLNLLPLGYAVIVLIQSMVLTVAKEMYDALDPLTSHQCNTMLALCSQNPAIQAYRTQVLSQGRQFLDLDLRLARRMASPEACRRLHGLAA